MENSKVMALNTENEELRDIEGYEGEYMVSSLGRVYSVKSGKFLKPSSDRGGYQMICLCKDKKKKTYKIHRLVASTFLENPLNLPQINHISEDKSDNRVENLEWCDAKYNCNYGTRTARISKLVLQFTKQGEFVKEYPSTHEAERQTGIYNGDISKCCRGKGLKSAGNYIWRYKEENVA